MQKSRVRVAHVTDCESRHGDSSVTQPGEGVGEGGGGGVGTLIINNDWIW